MATLIKIPDFIGNVPEAEFILGTHALELAFSDTAPGAESSPTTTAGNGILANVSQIVYTNYSDDLTADRVLTSGNVNSGLVGGVYTLDYTADIIITAITGVLPQWQYVYLFDQDSTTPADQLIAAWDHGSAINLALGESATLQVHANGLITIT